MMATFFAQRVILNKTKFEEIPSVLQPEVARILIESGLSDLVSIKFK